MAGAGYDDTQLLRDSQGAPIPQQYDPAGAVFRQLTGVNVDTGRYGLDTVNWGKTAGGVYVPMQINANGQLQIAGAAAHDAAASGNPVQVGGVYRLANPALADGDAGSIRLNAKGEPMVQVTGSNVEQTLNAALPTKANLIGISDGSKIQAMQGNISGTLLASAARTASATSPQIVNQNARGVQICLNITVASGTGGLITRAYGVDPLSGGIFIVNADPTAITATGTYVYEIYPGSSTGGVGGASKVSQRTAAVIPSKFYAFISHGDGSSYTYSVGYSLII